MCHSPASPLSEPIGLSPDWDALQQPPPLWRSGAVGMVWVGLGGAGRGVVGRGGAGSGWGQRVVGGPAYLAPELLRNESGPSKEGDVYAFGIVIFEGE
jgi:hypothetical protein